MSMACVAQRTLPLWRSSGIHYEAVAKARSKGGVNPSTPKSIFHFLSSFTLHFIKKHYFTVVQELPELVVLIKKRYIWMVFQFQNFRSNKQPKGAKLSQSSELWLRILNPFWDLQICWPSTKHCCMETLSWTQENTWLRTRLTFAWPASTCVSWRTFPTMDYI